MYFYYFISIISFLFSLVFSDPLKLSFKSRFNKNNMNKDNAMEMLINNDIFTQIEIGSNNQIIEMNIKLQKDSTFLLSTSCRENIFSKKFNENKSETYEILLPNKTYYMYEFKDGIHSKDNIILLSNTTKIKINDFKFMLATAIWDDFQKYMGGMIGLILTNKDDIPNDTDFITQLKSKKIIDSYIFMLDYKDNYNGVLYIGKYYHELDNKYSFDDFIRFKAGYEKSKFKYWEINIDKILTNNDIIQNETYIQFHYEMGIFASPDFYHDYIKEEFFKKYLDNGACKEYLNEEKIAIFKKYDYIMCNKSDIKIENFPILFFFNRENNYNFSFNYKDLFYEFENKVYFLVVFPRYPIDVKYWYIGKPFFLKYKLFMDKDNKIIGLYKKYTNDESEKDIIIQKNNKLNILYIIIIIVLIIILIIVLYYFLVVKKIRKKRANEMEDRYDYIPDSNDKKEKIINES